ncbi:MAG TPA: hypothetical protein VFP40_10655, partial [Terriglobales bacterium]|nr:hypothetical protein [Terriglobales bacterium]
RSRRTRVRRDKDNGNLQVVYEAAARRRNLGGSTIGTVTIPRSRSLMIVISAEHSPQSQKNSTRLTGFLSSPTVASTDSSRESISNSLPSLK